MVRLSGFPDLFSCSTHLRAWAHGGVDGFGHAQLVILILPAKFVDYSWEESAKSPCLVVSAIAMSLCPWQVLCVHRC